jgi:hypothetical protein
MSRAILLLWTQTDRDKAVEWIKKAPLGCIVEFRENKRTVAQNAKLWSMLTDVSRQVLHAGKRYPADTWKVLFMSALGHEVRFIPSLDSMSYVPLGFSSSELSKSEMSDLIEFIASEGVKRGVIFHSDPPIEDMEKAAGSEGAPPTAKKKEARINAPELPEFLTPDGE